MNRKNNTFLLKSLIRQVKRYRTILTIILIFTISFTVSGQNYNIKREFRGTWIATITNIDWPSSNSLSVEKQKHELRLIFDKLKSAGINAVFLQVRSEGDAFYDSPYEPWSFWLTGEQGKPPKPYYDPLHFAVNEAHKLGMEIYAWVNPYRVSRNGLNEPVAKNHVSRKHPQWILEFDSYKMLNPGIPDVNNYIVMIVTDIVERYDIDGVIFDDYLYPYPPKIKNEDLSTFTKHGTFSGGIEFWRRDNINKLVERVYKEIKKVKAYVKFGISPFGIIRNKFAGTRGLDAYSVLYSDPVTWLKEKTIDFIVPQIYWEIGKKNADYKRLVEWWSSICTERNLYIGQHSTKMTNPNYDGLPDEIINQIRLNRVTKNVSGSVFFSSRSIVSDNLEFADKLKNSAFDKKVLSPQMSWIDSIPPLPPGNLTAFASQKNVKLCWEKSITAEDGDSAYYYVIYKSEQGYDTKQDSYSIVDVISAVNCSYIDTSGSAGDYIVAALDRLWNESIKNPKAKYLSEKLIEAKRKP